MYETKVAIFESNSPEGVTKHVNEFLEELELKFPHDEYDVSYVLDIAPPIIVDQMIMHVSDSKSRIAATKYKYMASLYLEIKDKEDEDDCL